MMMSLTPLYDHTTTETRSMRFLIFGGTGPTGIALIRKALEVYPASTVFVYARSPQKVPADLYRHPSISIITGELAELDKVEAALAGRNVNHDETNENETKPIDIVISALGPTGPFHASGCPIANFYEKLIDLMAKHSVKRLLVLCTASYPDSHDKFSLATYTIVKTVSTLAYTAYADFKKVGEVVTQKGTEKELLWTVVRVPVLTNQDLEEVVAGYVGDGTTGNVLARKGFAAFCIGEIEKKEWIGKAPIISNANGCV